MDSNCLPNGAPILALPILPIFVLTSKDLNPEEKEYIRVNAGALFQKQEPWQEALIRQLQRVVQPTSLPTPA